MAAKNRRSAVLGVNGVVPVHQLGQITVGSANYPLLSLGAWSASDYYTPGNVVTESGVQYVCIAENNPPPNYNTPEQPPNATYWQVYDDTGLQLRTDQTWSSPVEAWHYVGNTGEPAFQNSWANVGSGAVPMRFRRIAGPIIPAVNIDSAQTAIELQGAVTGGSAGTTIFQLPDGYRPSYTLHLAACDHTGAFAVFTIKTDGEVVGGFV